MKTTLSITLPALLLAGPLSGLEAAAQQAAASDADTAAYRVYTGGGAASSLYQLLAATAGVDVVFLGESHNDLVGHRLQLQIFSRILGRAPATAGTMATTPGSAAPVRPLALSLEMFDRDVQYIVDEYLAGLITEDQLAQRPAGRSTRRTTRPGRGRPRWRPPGSAANAPRRYVNMVSRRDRRAVGTSLRMPADPAAAAVRAALGRLPGGTAGGDGTARRFDGECRGGAGERLSGAIPVGRRDGLVDRQRAAPQSGRAGGPPGGLVPREERDGHPEQLERYRPGTRRLIVYVEPVEDVKVFTPSTPARAIS
jgi:hypothetical protein